MVICICGSQYIKKKFIIIIYLQYGPQIIHQRVWVHQISKSFHPSPQLCQVLETRVLGLETIGPGEGIHRGLRYPRLYQFYVFLDSPWVHFFIVIGCCVRLPAPL